MAWGRLVFCPGGTEEQYGAVIEEIGDAHVDAPGRTYFAAGPRMAAAVRAGSQV